MVGVVCDVVQEQAEAEDDVTMGQRIGLAAGTTLQGTSEMVDNDIGAGNYNWINKNSNTNCCSI